MATRTRRMPVRARATRARRSRVWARQDRVLTGVGQTGTAQDLALGFQLDAGYNTTHLPVGVTIGGILLDFTASRVTAGTNVTTSQLMIAIICVDESDPTDVERPLDHPHADWMWYQTVSFPAVAAGTSVSTFQSIGGPLRIRARRKCQELGSHLFIVAQGFDIAPTFDFSYTSSVLLMLP